MLDKCLELGVEGIEMTGGGWSRAPHFRADRNGWVRLEMEDFTISTEAGIQSSVDALRATISR